MGKCQICMSGQNCTKKILNERSLLHGDVFAQVDLFFFFFILILIFLQFLFLLSVLLLTLTLGQKLFFCFFINLSFWVFFYVLFLLSSKNEPLCKIVTRAKFTNFVPSCQFVFVQKYLREKLILSS